MKQVVNISFKHVGLVVLLFISSYTYTQNLSKSEERRTLKKARKSLQKEDYPNAKKLYSKLVNHNPKAANYSYENGLSYFFSNKDKEKSIPLFESSITNMADDTIPEAFFYLGRAYHLNQEFEKSTNNFNSFIPFIDTDSKYGQDLLKQVEFYKQLNKKGKDFIATKDPNIKITNVGNKVNTSDREYAPVLYDDAFIFTSRRFNNSNKKAIDLLPYEDIYLAKKIDNTWQLINEKQEIKKYLPENINIKKHNASVSYAKNGTQLFAYKEDKLWYSNKENENWSELKEFDKIINSSLYNVPSITVSSDGNTIFFVTTKKDGIGGKDIYTSKFSNNQWSTPEILSTTINTPLDEDAPYLSDDGKTLYFASKGFDGLGGYDIYKSELVNGEWTPSIHMGIPINSPSDDIYFSIDKEEESGFLASNRIGTFGSLDIFSFSLSCPNIKNTQLRGLVYNKNSIQPLNAKLSLVDTENNKLVKEVVTVPSTGKFLLIAQPEKNYDLTIEADGFEQHKFNFSLPKQCEFYDLFAEIGLEQFVDDQTKKEYQIATFKGSFYNYLQKINELQKTSSIDTSNIDNVIPLSKTPNDNNYIDDKLLLAFNQTIDTSNIDFNYFILTDTLELPEGTLAKYYIPTFENIYFDFDKHSLRQKSIDELDKVADYMQSEKGKEMVLKIVGHTDSKGSNNYNIILSKRRANSALNYLVKKGVEKTKIVIEYRGEEEPEAPNLNQDGSDNPQNRQLNRRVTLSLTNPNTI